MDIGRQHHAEILGQRLHHMPTIGGGSRTERMSSGSDGGPPRRNSHSAVAQGGVGKSSSESWVAALLHDGGGCVLGHAACTSIRPNLSRRGAIRIVVDPHLVADLCKRKFGLARYSETICLLAVVLPVIGKPLEIAFL
jgi:hypothetical protein